MTCFLLQTYNKYYDLERREQSNLNSAYLYAENLFLLFDKSLTKEDLKLDEVQWQKLSNSVYPNKPLAKCKELSKIIQDLSPDIIMLCEVGGLESLKNFNTLFLNQEYSTALIEGNSDRNIDVRFLVKKALPFYFDLQPIKIDP